MDFEVKISSGLMTAIHVVIIDLLLAWLIVTGVDDLLAAHQRQKWFDEGKVCPPSVIWILKAGPFGDYAGTNSDNFIRVGTAIVAFILAVITGLGLEGFTKQTWRTQEIVWIVLDHENPFNYTSEDLLIDRGAHDPRRSQKNVLLSLYLSCLTSTEKEDVWTPAIIGEEGEFERCLDIEEAEINDALKLWPRSGETGTKITCSDTPTSGKSHDPMEIDEVHIKMGRVRNPSGVNSNSEAGGGNVTEPPEVLMETNCTWEGMEFVKVSCFQAWCVGFGRNADDSDVIVWGQRKHLPQADWNATKPEELTSVVVPGLKMENLDCKRLLLFFIAGYDIGRSLQIVSMMASKKVRAKIKTGTTAATRVSSWYVPVVGGFFAFAMALRLVTFIVYRNPIDLRGRHDRLDTSGIWSLYVKAETGGSESHKKCEYKGIEIGWNEEEQHFGIVEDISQV